MNNIKTGVVLARLQPIHKGHLELIEQACDENDQVFIFIGSADKFNQRNPIPINLRVQLAEEALEELAKKYLTGVIPADVHIVPLDDLTDESDNSHDWGFYLFTKIIKETDTQYFTIYYSDGFEIITTWFPSFVLRNNVSLKLIARGATCSGISATKVRKMILNGDDEELKKWVPQCVYDCKDTLKKHIELANMIK
ncbi:MAG: adenylyltransferase/cytidyltransferase family protein [Prevotella sp.]|jgi:cytidyltransferase-like protein|nr:adenylyltransferase/cytidyltransferase family protein [Prevotella sp.]